MKSDTTKEYVPTVKQYGLLFLKAVIVFVVGLIVLKILTNSVEHLLQRYYSPYLATLTGEFLHYIGLFLIAMTILDIIGIKTTQFLGAAGVVGVAIGFASQTSLSNIISGIFLIGEHPFVIGDTLKIDSYIGRVDSIDLLSVKLVTTGNDYIRIPNAYLVTNSFMNLTRYGAKRIGIDVRVSYDTDLKKAATLLNSIGEKNPYKVATYEVSTLVTSFGDAGINLTLYSWVAYENINKTQSWLLDQINTEFNKAGIVMPWPEMIVDLKGAPKPEVLLLPEKKSNDADAVAT